MLILLHDDVCVNIKNKPVLYMYINIYIHTYTCIFLRYIYVFLFYRVYIYMYVCIYNMYNISVINDMKLFVSDFMIGKN